MLEHVQMPPDQFLRMIVTGYFALIVRTLISRPKTFRLPNLQAHQPCHLIKLTLYNLPLVRQPKHLMEQFLWCHPHQRNDLFH